MIDNTTMIDRCPVSRSIWTRPAIIGSLLSLGCAQLLLGDGGQAEIPAGQYVADSLHLVREGADPVNVLQTLSSLARSDEVKWRVGKAAVGALFHIAQDDATIRHYLLEIIADNRTKSSPHRSALELLVYVADEEAQSTVLRLFKAEWPSSRWGGYFNFFIALSDTAFLRWAEALEGPEPGGVPRHLIDNAITRIRVQSNVDDLLAYLETGATELYVAWAVRQALRHGARRDRIRAVVLSSLSTPASDGPAIRRAFELVHQCDELGILEAADAQGFPIINRARHFAERMSKEGGGWLAWAEPSIEAKKAAFYGFDR